ncbi:unnamed protein product, partial [Prorocentrum cordatum]
MAVLQGVRCSCGLYGPTAAGRHGVAAGSEDREDGDDMGEGARCLADMPPMTIVTCDLGTALVWLFGHEGPVASGGQRSHSSDILDLLEDLKEKAEEDLAALRKAETNAKQNYEMLKQSLTDANNNDNKDMADEKAAKQAAEEEKASDTSDLGMTVKALADANAALESVKGECMTVAADHEASVAGRNAELKTIAEATKIIKETSSGAVAQSYSLVQVSAGRSQLRTSADLRKAEVISAVQQLAKQYHSSALAQLASRIQAVVRLGGAAGEDPFVK